MGDKWETSEVPVGCKMGDTVGDNWETAVREVGETDWETPTGFPGSRWETS